MSQDPPATTAPPAAHDPYAALRLREFRFFLTGSLLGWIGLQMQTVAVFYYIYHSTHNNLCVGLVGLAQVIPVLALGLAAGHVADRFDRRRVLLAAELLLMGCSVGLAVSTHLRVNISVIYVILVGIGVGRAFQGPAKSAFLPQIIPRGIFSNAVTWNSTGFQIASVVGPALGGFILRLLDPSNKGQGDIAPIFILDALATLSFLTALLMIRRPPFVPTHQAATLEALAAGVRFVLRTKIVLAAITLDLFAVLLGGAVALLPAYSADILHVGSIGYGWLQSAPALGAFVMALLIAHRPMRSAGKALLFAVAGFGVATIVFGFSRWFPLSMAMLFLTGAFDAVSVVVRHTLVQVLTPDAMRGRVSAVNGMFISASNELGGFESGLVAWLFARPLDPSFGPTVSVVAGGVGTLIVVVIVAVLWPQVRRFGALDSGPTEGNSAAGA